MSKQKVLVVLSGGQDSTTCLAWAVKMGFDVAAVTFNYDQRHQREIQAARDVAALAGVVNHEIISMGPILSGTSPLTNPTEQLETYKDYASMDGIIGDRIEKTFVPMRNALFLTIAANRAVCLGATSLITGVCEADNANYPDCRQSFISSQEWTLNEALGTNDAPNRSRCVRIRTPLIHMTKAKSIHMMHDLGCIAWLAFSHTAYDGAYPPVGKDHASVLRAQGFLEAHLPDPLVLRANWEGLMALPETSNYHNAVVNGLMLEDIMALMAGRPTQTEAA
jgi:7-cyano-7-deazaguanine synthase